MLRAINLAFEMNVVVCVLTSGAGIGSCVRAMCVICYPIRVCVGSTAEARSWDLNEDDLSYKLYYRCCIYRHIFNLLHYF